MVNPTIPINFPGINATVLPQSAKETIQTWVLNDIGIHLIKEQNLLKYETISSSGEKLKTDTIALPPDSDLNEIIVNLKKCKALLDTEGTPVFVESYKRWEVDNREIDLVHGPQDLLWHIYCNSTKITSVFTVREATIPSKQCHSNTIDLIEKIKSNASTVTHVRHLQNDFTVTRIIEGNQIQSEQLRFRYDLRTDGIASEKHLNNMYREGLGVGLFAGYVGLSASWGSICAATSAVSASFGGGVLGGAIAGSCVGLPLTLGAGLVLPITAATGYICYSFLKTHPPRRTNAEMERRIDMMPPRKPLFVEIEPISFPSDIDEKVKVSKFIWGVTLVTYQETCHAEIIIEGINDGFYNHDSLRIGIEKTIAIGEKFIHLAHYQPKIESGLIGPERLQFRRRTEVWLRPSEKIKKMLNVIQEEMLLPREARCSYNKYGIDSKLPKISKRFKQPGHNCVTWAREKLHMIDIDLGESLVGFIATTPIAYTTQQENYT